MDFPTAKKVVFLVEEVELFSAKRCIGELIVSLTRHTYVGKELPSECDGVTGCMGDLWCQLLFPVVSFMAGE